MTVAPASARRLAFGTRIASLGRVDAATLFSLFLSAGTAAALAAASIYRHDHFGSNAYDLGLFDQTIWPTFLSYLLRVDLRAGRSVLTTVDPLMLEDFVPQVTGIITVGEFYEHAGGGQIVFT